jgi:hypothetical protein
MLPQHMSGSFGRYKKETDFFITWLVSAAVRCGYSVHPQAEPVTVAEADASKGPRLKGKARKLARQKETAASLSEATPKSKKLTIAALLDCANQIATAKSSSAQVPHTVYKSLLMAIKLRSECSVWFAQQEHCVDNEDLKRSNITHGFFNTILENIRQLLEPFAEPPPAQQPHVSADPESASSTSNNMYDALSQMSLSDKENSEDDEPSRRPASSAVDPFRPQRSYSRRTRAAMFSWRSIACSKISSRFV